MSLVALLCKNTSERAATIDNETILWLHPHMMLLPFSFLGELIFLLLQVNIINLASWDTTEGENDRCQPHKIVLQKITSTILFLPFSMAHGGEGAPQMGTWNLWGENLNIAKFAWHPPREPCEHPLWEAAAYLRAPLSSISQENGSKKKLYSSLATWEDLCPAARRDAQKEEW